MRYDNYALSQYKTCLRKGYYRIDCGLVPKEEKPSSALRFGAAIHSALELLYTSIKEGKTPDPMEVVARFVKEFPEDAQTEKDTQEVGANILLAYMKKWLPEPFTVIDVEVGFIVPLWSQCADIDLCGRIDLIIEWNGIIYAMEHKSSGKMYQQTRPNNQIVGYAFPLFDMYPNSKGVGAILNTMGKFKKFEPDKHLLREVKEVMPWEFERLAKDVLCTHQHLMHCRAEKVWPMNTSMCSWGAPCAYRDLCAADPDFEERIREASFDVKKWEPYPEGEE